MFKAVYLRRFISCLTIFMLVWCQTSAAAQAGLIATTQSIIEVAAVAPCHQTATDDAGDTTQRTDCQTRCQSHNAWFESAKLQLPSIDDLPLAAISTPIGVPVVAYTVPIPLTPERAAPPPLILVYGRLLI